MVRYTLSDLSSFNFFELCFIAQHMAILMNALEKDEDSVVVRSDVP